MSVVTIILEFFRKMRHDLLQSRIVCKLITQIFPAAQNSCQSAKQGRKVIPFLGEEKPKILFSFSSPCLEYLPRNM